MEVGTRRWPDLSWETPSTEVSPGRYGRVGFLSVLRAAASTLHNRRGTWGRWWEREECPDPE
jgi:hypothetical protein